MTAAVPLPRDVGPVIGYLRDRVGLRFDGHRAGELVDHVRSAMRTAGASDVYGYVELLEREPDRFDALVDDLTIGESHFFRESTHFDVLRGRILPELARRSSGLRPIRMWSAGCASGEEPYTLAIVAREAGLADRIEIVGTDINGTAIADAREATYRAWSLRGVDVERRGAYFRPEGDRFRLDGRISRAVAFHRSNLLGERSLVEGRFDVIFCRNVLIYLTPPAATAAAHRLVGALADGGWLITASSDPILDPVDGFERVAVSGGGAVYRRTPATAGTEPGDVAGTRGRGSPRRPAVRHGLRSAGRSRGALARDGRPGRSGRTATPLDAHGYYLRSLLLIDSRRWGDATAAAASALYLDPSLVVAEIARGRAELGRGDRTAAARAFRNARRLLERLPDEEQVAHTDGTSAGRLLAELGLLVTGTGEAGR